MTTTILSDTESRLYGEALAFLEKAAARQEIQAGTPALALNFAKVVSDSRAIRLLTQNGLYLQAAIVARSTLDACNLLMHIGAEGEETAIVKRWLAGQRMTHWMLLDRLNERLKRERLPAINVDDYRQLRKRLDDLVHANYEALKLYPAQSPKPDVERLGELTFWSGLLKLYLVVCLLTVLLTVPDLQEQAAAYLDRLLQT